MKTYDVELIQRVLTGDDDAFSELIKKYQKPVHVLVWRKIGDFHIAEEITQDTFLIAYQKLRTLKNLHQFSGWLYVIATRRCYAWLRKKRIRTHPLEDAETTMTQRDAYSKHVAEEQARIAVETQREVVNKLLAKLKESERTVMTLHYLGEMTIEEISKFIGVSTGTIKSRLRRARNRLQSEETMIREALDHFQFSPNLDENIMQKINRMKPVVPSNSKPLLPWGIAASSAILIMLMLGIGSQYLPHFQKPYSLDAQSEMMVELLDTPVLLNLETIPDNRNQFGNSLSPGESDDTGQKPDDVLAAAQTKGEDASVPKQQWIQAEPIKGSEVICLLATPEDELYAFANRNIYKLETDGNGWQHVFDTNLLDTDYEGKAILKKWDNTLYLILSTDLFGSKDDGKTWDLVHSWHRDFWYPIGMVITEYAFYISFFIGDDVFRSEDSGITWKSMNNRIKESISSIVNIQDTLYAMIDNALCRLTNDKWERLEFPSNVSKIRSVATTEKNLYVLAEVSDDVLDTGRVSKELEQGWWILRSTNLGDSWVDITPTNAWALKGLPPRLKLIAVGETLLAMEHGMVRSIDSGNTWLPPQLSSNLPAINADEDFTTAVAAVNEHVFYVSGRNGLYRSTDSGKSWKQVNIATVRSNINALIAYKRNGKKNNMPSTLYASYEGRIVKTTDEGKSWIPVQIEIPMKELEREKPPDITHIVKSDGVLYAKGGGSFSRGKTNIYRVSTDGNTLVPIHGMPIFDSLTSYVKSFKIIRNQFKMPDKSVIEQMQEEVSGATQFFKQLAQTDGENRFKLFRFAQHGPFAVSGDTFYMEFNYKLFRWKPGETEWHGAGMEETVELSLDTARKKLKLAVSGDTIYVGKRDGHLVVSYDKGKHWTDLTSALPFHVKTFNEILVVGSTIYVATDAGNITSNNGRNWRVVTGAKGRNIIMEHLAADGTSVYGTTKETGIYRWESGVWKQIIPDVPYNVTSLAVDGNTVYIGTESNGMLGYVLDE